MCGDSTTVPRADEALIAVHRTIYVVTSTSLTRSTDSTEKDNKIKHGE